MVEAKRAALRCGVGLLAGVLILGCGSSESEAPDKERAFAKQQANRQQKIERLEDELQHERTRRAKEAQKANAKASQTGGKLQSSSSSADFQDLEAQLPGEVGIAIGPPGSAPAATAGALQTGSA